MINSVSVSVFPEHQGVFFAGRGWPQASHECCDNGKNRIYIQFMLLESVKKLWHAFLRRTIVLARKLIEIICKLSNFTYLTETKTFVENFDNLKNFEKKVSLA